MTHLLDILFAIVGLCHHQPSRQWIDGRGEYQICTRCSKRLPVKVRLSTRRFA